MTLRTTVRRVVLDVIVTDAQGRPVPGLKLSDFSIAEDGRRQQPLSFDVHGFDDTMEYTPPKLPEQPPNTFVNLPSTPERGPLYVLLYDLVNTEPTDQIFVRKQLVKFIEEKPAGARFAIFVFSDGLHLVQGFTSDQKQLFAAVDPSRSRPHVPMLFTMGVNNGKGDAKTMQDVFTTLGRYLEGLPGRKNVVWLSGDFPLSLFASNDEMASYQAKTRQMLDLLARDQISIYPVSSRGVVDHGENALPQATSASGGTQADTRQSIAEGQAAAGAGSTSSNANNSAGAGAPAAPLGGGAGYSLIMAGQMTADEVARVTGGRAFYSTNNVQSALNRATNDGLSYYTLSYAPTNLNFNGKPRLINVQLAERSYTLSYRRAYYGVDSPAPGVISGAVSGPESAGAAGADQAGARQVDDLLSAALQHGAPMAHQIVFASHLHALNAPTMGTRAQMAALLGQAAALPIGRHAARPLPPVKLQTIAIDYAVIARQFAISGLNTPPTIEVAAAAYDADGNLLSAVANKTVEGDAPTSTDPAKKLYRIGQRIEVPAGAVTLRLAMRDMRTDRIGALEVSMPLAPEPQTTAASSTDGRPR
ncbi:MAG TPA: VWA domain-containing protein [Acidobacteriaceae bacterium]